MEDAYKAWKDKPTPANFNTLMERAEPTIQSALKSYAGGNEALKSKAKLLAANALKTYDPKRGTQINTHLMSQMQPLTRHAREYNQVVKVPERVSVDLYKLKQEQQKFFDRHNREASDQELADSTGLSMKRLAKVRQFEKGEVAESGLTESEDGDTAIMYPGTSKIDPQAIWLEYVHHDLAPLDRKILEWKTGYNGKATLSTGEIAKRLNLTPGAVSQRTAKIAAKLEEGRGVENAY